MAIFDRESMYLMLQKHDWDGLAATLVKHEKELKNDPITQQAVMIFESEYFADCAGYASKTRYQKFENISVMIELGRHGFSKAFQERFIDEKLKVMEELGMDSLLSYALSKQHRPAAQKIIQAKRGSQPEQIANARRGDVLVKASQVTAGAPKTIKLFKSRQEEHFFEAVRNVFPTYNPYPNVALSSILDFEAIKDQLTPRQREFFFRAVVDSVVFDARSSFKPKFFIELDSIHHDNARAVENDAMKDAIFKAANVQLIRVRGFGEGVLSVAEFERLVLELLPHRSATA